MTREEFRTTLNNIMVQKNFMPADVGHIVGVDTTTITRWKRGALCPLDGGGYRSAIIERIKGCPPKPQKIAGK